MIPFSDQINLEPLSVNHPIFEDKHNEILNNIDNISGPCLSEKLIPIRQLQSKEMGVQTASLIVLQRSS